MAVAPNPCADSFLSQVWSGNVIVCAKTFKDYETKSAQDQIQTVVNNANTYYGTGSSAAQVAEATATQQEAQSSADVTNVTDAVASSKVGQIFTTCGDGNSGLAIPGLPCIDFKYMLYFVVAMVLLYALALVSSIVPRPR
jgi:hypothetical protein